MQQQACLGETIMFRWNMFILNMFRLKCEHSLIVLVETLKDCNPKFYILLNQKLRIIGQ